MCFFENDVSMLPSGKTRTVLSLVGLVSITALVVVLFIRATDENEEMKDKENHTKYVVTSVPIPETLDFAGERTPLENFDEIPHIDKATYKYD